MGWGGTPGDQLLGQPAQPIGPGNCSDPAWRHRALAIPGPHQSAGDGSVGVRVTPRGSQPLHAAFEDRLVVREPERDLDTMHHVPRLSSGNRQFLAPLEWHPSDRIAQYYRSVVAGQCLKHVADEVAPAAEEAGRSDIDRNRAPATPFIWMGKDRRVIASADEIRRRPKGPERDWQAARQHSVARLPARGARW